MTVARTQHSFISGEVSPAFHGRTDLTKFDSGLKLCENFFVEFRGGISTRPGTLDCAPIEGDSVRLFRFEATTDDYLLVFGLGYMRPVRNGGYLLEDFQTITDITGKIVTCAGHGYAVGDWVWIRGVSGMNELNLRYFEITSAGANTFTINLPNGVSLDVSDYGTYTGNGSVARTVRVETVYDDAEKLKELRFEQRLNRVIITSLNYKVRKLTYVSDTSWNFVTLEGTSEVESPENLTLAPAIAGTAGVMFAVTAVNGSEESTPSDYAVTELTADYTLAEGSITLTWDAVAGADQYYVYRSLVAPVGADISRAQDLGYLGRAYGPQFIDANIVPDFTKSPPINYDPFADEAITSIEVTAGGTGYSNASVVSVADPDGEGFSGIAVVSTTGVLLSIIITRGGKNYSAPVISVSGGTGATFTSTRTPANGSSPRLFTSFQQRAIFAGSTNEPMRLWATKPGMLNNFDISSVLNAGDGYSFQIDAKTVKPIYHLMALRAGLLVFTANQILLLRAEEGKALSGVNAVSEPQAYKGVSLTPPIAIDLDVIFVQVGSAALNAMLYTEYTSTFQMQDVAILSNHLIGLGKEIERLEWLNSPNKLLFCLREDGKLLTLTYEREQEVFGWAQHKTQGKFVDICAINETSRDTMYCAVERYLQGEWHTRLERFAYREFDYPEDAICVDSAVQSALTYPDLVAEVGTLTVSNPTIQVIGEDFFTEENLGDIVYIAGGRGEIVEIETPRIARVEFSRLPTEVVPWNVNIVFPQAAGSWAIATPVTVVSNLWHLENKLVSVLADGDAYLEQEVVDGTITLPLAATKVVVGLKYECRAETLPLTLPQEIIDGKRKDVISVAVKLNKTRGLSVGEDFEAMEEIPDRSDEDWGEEIGLRDDMVFQPINAKWTEESTVKFEQTYPLPATILSLTTVFDVGDD